jgi:spermidine synthase
MPETAPGRTTPIALLLFGSGLCSLVYQTVWLRELRSVFGSSTPATAAVIGIFMGGLGVGGVMLGRFADRHRNPLLLYAMLEGGVAATALLTIPIVRLVETVYFASGGSVTLGTTGATMLRLLLATAMLGAPTFLMGGTLPAAARSVVADADVKRRAIALLYGVNTLGAVLGALLSTFFALELLGNRKTLIVAVLLNLLVVVAARARSREERFERGKTQGGAQAAAPETGALTPLLFTWIAAGVAGFAFLLMELVWYRMLAPILGGSTFTFGLILAMALLGIGLGGLAYSFLLDDRPASLSLFAVTCGLESVAIVVPFALGDRLATLAALLRSLGTLGFGGDFLAWTSICAAVVLPAAIVSGFQFPALIALAGQGRAHVGSDVGRVYAFNTLGAIAGSVAGGFGLMPVMTALGCWRLAAGMMIVLCAAASVLAYRHERHTITGPALALVAAGLVVAATGPTSLWRHSPIGAGRVEIVGKTTNEMLEWAHFERRRVVWQAEGIESGVALVGEDGIAFFVNGKSDGHSIGDAGTQVMGGLLGAILHPAPKRSLVIGLGTGSTAGWLGRVAGMERVDVAELEPAIKHVAEVCAPVNESVLEQPNVHVRYGDAREILLVSSDRYDIIFSEPSNPYRSGVASLFTQEFYAAAAGRLDRGGIFLQWVQAYEIDGRTIETIVRTIHSIFGHVQIWQTKDKDMVLVATRAPLAVDVARVRTRVGEEPYRSALAHAWKVDSAEGFLAHFVADEAFATHVATRTHADLNTDDRNVVEFGLARSVGKGRSEQMAEVIKLAASMQMRDHSFAGAYDAALVRRFRATSPMIAGTDSEEERGLASAVAAYKASRFSDAVSAWRAASGGEPRSHFEALLLAESLAQMGEPSYVTEIERLRAYDPIEASVVEAIYFYRMGRGEDAARLLAEAFVAFRAWPWADWRLMGEATAMADTLATSSLAPTKVAQLEEAFSKPFSMLQIEDLRKWEVFRIARWLEPRGCGPKTIAALALYEPNVPWRQDVLEPRALCYRAARPSLAGVAARDYAEFRANEAEVFGENLK